MIPLNFTLFYSGAPLSYLRYLTFKSLRHFHPHSRIQLFTTKKFKVRDHNWFREKQDFEGNYKVMDYMSQLKDLNIEVVILDRFAETYNPVIQSDLFRYWHLYSQGGFYLDTDQIILKPFDSLPLQYDFLYSMYFNPQCGMYFPVGVLGCVKNYPVMDYIVKNIVKYYHPNHYNSTGPGMLLDVLGKVKATSSFNMPSVAWYPAQNSDLVEQIYNGKLELTDKSWAVHWYGGHSLSQEFNKKYTEEFARTSNDTISRFLRKNNLL